MFVKGHDLSNNLCEYEVNRLTNEKVILEVVYDAGGTATLDEFTNL